MAKGVQLITHQTQWALHSIEATRLLEQAAQASLPAHTLMRRAGLAVAQLTLALAPHSQRIWIACGAGNNGGDGLEAAFHLTQRGKHVQVSWLGSPLNAPPDALASYQRALQAGVKITDSPPAEFDFAVDALMGLGGQTRPPTGQLAHWINTINTSDAPVLAVDLPSGLCANTGTTINPSVHAQHTLSLLTLKPGLFMAQGRDSAGKLWLDDLSAMASPSAHETASAWLACQPPTRRRAHASHKGSFGDVAVIGGAPGMTGAALLAGSSALYAGAGRVFVGLLHAASPYVDPLHPELMFRDLDKMDLDAMVLVCGCGAGTAVDRMLPRVLSSPAPVVIDADAITSIAGDKSLQNRLRWRRQQGWASVLTPHPLEAARLLGVTTPQIQNHRLAAASEISDSYGCVVVLKGSGTITKGPGHAPMLNPTGNARLATAGTGDVLAGLIGARLASGQDAFNAAWQAVYLHGQIADEWTDLNPALVASQLARHLRAN